MRIPEATTQFADFTQRRVGLEFENPSYELLKPLVDIAFRGLRKRNCKEENYRVSLYDRIEQRENPATIVNKILERQGREVLLNAITYDRP